MRFRSERAREAVKSRELHADLSLPIPKLNLCVAMLADHNLQLAVLDMNFFVISLLV